MIAGSGLFGQYSGVPEKRSRLITLVTTAFINRVMTNLSADLGGDHSNHRFLNRVQNLSLSLREVRYIPASNPTELIDFAVVLIFPFSVSFLMPLFVNQFVMEKEGILGGYKYVR